MDISERRCAPRLADDPKYWRARREQIRVVAEATRDPNSSGIMLRIADDYEKLAVYAERRCKSS